MRDVGFYYLQLDPERGGTDNFVKRLSSAENQPPSTLKYSAGILLMGGSPDSKNTESISASMDALKLVLGKG